MAGSYALLEILSGFKPAPKNIVSSIHSVSVAKRIGVTAPFSALNAKGELHQILESINILYYVSGGVASSIHGEARSTRDLDLVISLEVERVDIIVQTLETAGFYCPALAVENIKQGRERSLSITHIVTIANADLIIMDNSPFAVSQMARRILASVEGVSPFWVASREDMVLQKLMWGRGSQSEKQWRDVLGIIKLQAENLDYGYLVQWAESLDLVDALTRAFAEAGV